MLDATSFNSKSSQIAACSIHAHISRLFAILPLSQYHSAILDRIRLLQQVWQLALLRLQLGVAANVLLVDKDVGHGALRSHSLESVLDRSTVI